MANLTAKTDDELNRMAEELAEEVQTSGRAYQAARLGLSAVRSELAARMRARASKRAS